MVEPDLPLEEMVGLVSKAKDWRYRTSEKYWLGGIITASSSEIFSGQMPAFLVSLTKREGLFRTRYEIAIIHSDGEVIGKSSSADSERVKPYYNAVDEVYRKTHPRSTRNRTPINK